MRKDVKEKIDDELNTSQLTWLHDQLWRWEHKIGKEDENEEERTD